MSATGEARGGALRAILGVVRGHWMYSKLNFEDLTISGALVGGVGATLAAAVWLELTLLAFLAYVFCFAACINAAKELFPDYTAGLTRIVIPEDRSTIRSAAEAASEFAQRFAVIVNRALSFEDVRTSAIVLAMVFVLTPFASAVTASSALVVLVVATGLCVADRMARVHVDALVASKVEPLLIEGAGVVRRLSAQLRARVKALPTQALAAAGGAVCVAVLFGGSVWFLFALVRIASAALLVHAAAEALADWDADPAGAGGDSGITWAGDPAHSGLHED